MSAGKNNNYPKSPPRPVGTSSEARFMQLVWDFIWDPKTNLFVDSPNVRFDKTSKGYVPVIKIQSSSASTPGGSQASFWSSSAAYASGAVVQVLTTTTYNSITILPGTYMLMAGLSTSASPTGNQIPQYPYPGSGTTYWMYLGALPRLVQTCSGGSAVPIYINSTASF